MKSSNFLIILFLILLPTSLFAQQIKMIAPNDGEGIYRDHNLMLMFEVDGIPEGAEFHSLAVEVEGEHVGYLFAKYMYCDGVTQHGHSLEILAPSTQRLCPLRNGNKIRIVAKLSADAWEGIHEGELPMPVWISGSIRFFSGGELIVFGDYVATMMVGP